MDKRRRKEAMETLGPVKSVYAAKSETTDDFEGYDFLVSCENEIELKDCVEAIGIYNRFNPSKIKKALTAVNFSEILGCRYWKIKIGIESSPIMLIISKENSSVFREKCREFAKITGADECDFYVKVSAENQKKFELDAGLVARNWTHLEVSCRIWWD